jgi:hypothetical protein
VAPVVPRDLARVLTLELKPSRGDHDGGESKLDGDVDTTSVALFASVLSAIGSSGNNIPLGCFLWECISPVASDGVPQLSSSYVVAVVITTTRICVCTSFPPPLPPAPCPLPLPLWPSAPPPTRY